MAIVYGSNITAVNHLRGLQKLWEYLKFKGTGLGPAKARICQKAGIPASNTAADDPGQAPAFILDTTNGAVYYCHTRASSSSFTLVKVTA